MDGAFGRSLAETAAVKNPLGHRDVAKMRNGLSENARKILGRILAGLAAGSVSPVDESVLGVRLDHHERDGRPHLDGLELVGAEIALDESTLGAIHRRGLIKKTAGAAGEGVLSLLANLGHCRLILLDAVKLRKSENRAHLERCGRAKTRAERDVAEEHTLPTLLRFGGIAVEEPVESTGNIILPRHLLSGSDRRNRELRRLHQIGGRKLARLVIRRADGEERTLIDRGGKYVTLIIVSVVT